MTHQVRTLKDRVALTIIMISFAAALVISAIEFPLLFITSALGLIVLNVIAKKRELRREAYRKKVLAHYAEEMLHLWRAYHDALKKDTEWLVLQAMLEEIIYRRTVIRDRYQLDETEIPNDQYWRLYLPTDAKDRWLSPVRGRLTGREADRGLSAAGCTDQTVSVPEGSA